MLSESQQATFESVIKLTNGAPTLSYYNPHKNFTLENDAREYGLGAAMKQRDMLYMQVVQCRTQNGIMHK